MTKKKSSLILMLFFLLVHLFINSAIAGNIIKIGVASENITPENAIMLVGFAARTEPSKGVAQNIFTKAIAFEDNSGSRAILLTTDLIGFFSEFSDEITQRVERELNIPRECLMLTSSHTHTAPLLEGTNLRMYDLTQPQSEEVSKYTKVLKEKIFTVIQKSIQNLEPAKLSFGVGKANFAINRRVFTSERVKIGVNPDGPVDHDVPVLAASDTAGNLISILFGYACHGTTLGKDDYFQVCGDYMGYACEYLEETVAGITSLFVTGCAGDQNPYPRGTLKDARLHGLQLAGAVADVIRLERIPVTGLIKCLYKTVKLPFAEIPTEEQFRERLKSDNAHVRRNAEYFIDRLKSKNNIPSTYPYPIQVWQFGRNLTMVSLGGEVVVDYSLRLKRELEVNNLWPIAYANDVCGYVGSARILYEGGYEADNSTIYYSLPSKWDYDVEEKIVNTVKEMIQESKK
jgi:hypothetical protein